MTNAGRADIGRKVMRFYQDITGQWDTNFETVAADMMADLFHFLWDEVGTVGTHNEAINRALNYFENEIEEDRGAQGRR